MGWFKKNRLPYLQINHIFLRKASIDFIELEGVNIKIYFGMMKYEWVLDNERQAQENFNSIVKRVFVEN